MQWISLLRFDNKQYLWINSEKTNLSNNLFEYKFLSFSKSWDCLEFVIDQRVWDRISACIVFRFASVTSVILVFCRTSLFVCLLRSVVFLRGSRWAFLLLVCWPREVCVLRGSRSLSWWCCKWSRFDCLMDFLIGFWEDWM